MKHKYKSFIIKLTLLVTLFHFSCTKLVEVDAPRTDLVTASVFSSNSTANAAVLDIYFNLINSSMISGSTYGISFLGSLYADDIIHYQNYQAAEYQQFNDNNLQAGNSMIASLWTRVYRIIYKCNSALEGLQASTGVTGPMKTQLEAEARFVRAFCYFYMVNMWGDVPLVLTTDYKINNTIARTPTEEIYKQITEDLKAAQAVLPNDYAFANNQRVRANKGAATAMLARVYLYRKEWANAEQQATAVINTTSYSLEPNLALVYRTTSPEAILQLWYPVYPSDRSTFAIFSYGPGGGSFRPEFLNGIEAGDQRWAVYGQTMEVQGVTYYGALKYRDFTRPPLDFLTVLRLAEQYLIRAEARAQQGKLTGANSAEPDINIIRNRAGLANTTAATKEELLLAVEQERRYEFFTEMGHRWFDIKRTGRAAALLGPLKPGWQAAKELFPIPEVQIINDPNVTQNPGY